jgi:NTE family protein
VSEPGFDRAIVVALGGGGARGLAHLGVLDELSRAGFRVSAIAGTSSGALLGALWALSGFERAVARVREFADSGLGASMPDMGSERGGRSPVELARRAWGHIALMRVLFGRGRYTTESFLSRVRFFLPDVLIEETPVRMLVVATDHATGEEVWLERGSLPLAVAASSAMPGLLPPVPWGERRLQDGGAVAEIPVRAARTLGSPVVAVEVSEALPSGNAERDRGARAMFRAAAIGWQELRRRMLVEADAVIAPAVNALHWANYRAVDEAVAAGRAAAREFVARQTSARAAVERAQLLPANSGPRLPGARRRARGGASQASSGEAGRATSELRCRPR